jgi:NAD(P)-dependent dehydrogenase (short-subunit alcohol dehydrogenase family)
MDLQLSGKRAIVTGGSRGIGRAIARALAAEGAAVVIAARDEQTLVAAAAELSTETGIQVVAVPADTGDQCSVDHLVERAVAEIGGVDILVNAAATPWGADQPSGFEAISDDMVRAEVEIKVLGYLRTARAVSPHLIAQGWGRIINISGLGARQATSIAHTIRNVTRR